MLTFGAAIYPPMQLTTLVAHTLGCTSTQIFVQAMAPAGAIASVPESYFHLLDTTDRDLPPLPDETNCLPTV
jgi:hypothetical protein